MALSFRIRNAQALVMCDALVDSIDAGAGAGTIPIFTGTAPTNCEDADTGTLLATLTFSDPAFGPAADAAPGATATANAITSDVSADAAGTAGYFRFKDSDLVVRCQGECGTSGADLNFNTVVIAAGAEVAITAYTVTVPEI